MSNRAPSYKQNAQYQFDGLVDGHAQGDSFLMENNINKPHYTYDNPSPSLASDATGTRWLLFVQKYEPEAISAPTNFNNGEFYEAFWVETVEKTSVCIRFKLLQQIREVPPLPCDANNNYTKVALHWRRKEFLLHPNECNDNYEIEMREGTTNLLSRVEGSSGVEGGNEALRGRRVHFKMLTSMNGECYFHCVPGYNLEIRSWKESIGNNSFFTGYSLSIRDLNGNPLAFDTRNNRFFIDYEEDEDDSFYKDSEEDLGAFVVKQKNGAFVVKQRNAPFLGLDGRTERGRARIIILMFLLAFAAVFAVIQLTLIVSQSGRIASLTQKLVGIDQAVSNIENAYIGTNYGVGAFPYPTKGSTNANDTNSTRNETTKPNDGGPRGSQEVEERQHRGDAKQGDKLGSFEVLPAPLEKPNERGFAAGKRSDKRAKKEATKNRRGSRSFEPFVKQRQRTVRSH